MTTHRQSLLQPPDRVVEAYRLDRYDNTGRMGAISLNKVVEAYRLDRYDNLIYTKNPHVAVVLQCGDN